MQHRDAYPLTAGCAKGEPQDCRGVSRMVDANDHAGSCAARTDIGGEADHSYRAWGASKSVLRPTTPHPEDSCWLITTEHHQSAFRALTADARRRRTGVEMRRYFKVGRYLVSATHRLTRQAVGRLDGIRVIDERVEDSERTHAQGPRELMHYAELAPAGYCLSRSPVQCLPAGRRTVDSHQHWPQVLACLLLRHRIAVNTTSGGRRRRGVDTPEQPNTVKGLHSAPPVGSAVGAAVTSASR